MDEYIEREAAYEDFERCNTENPKWTPSRVKTLIARQKAADVAPVVHGQWVHEHISEGYAWVICSECEAVIHKILINKRLNYCPNCGAKIDLEDEQ